MLDGKLLRVFNRAGLVFTEASDLVAALEEAGYIIVPAEKRRHFKGKIYYVLGEAKNTETLEDTVVYTNEARDELWTRPKDMFHGKTADGRERFTLVPIKTDD